MPSLFSFPGTCSKPGAEGRAQHSRAGLETALSLPGLSCRFLPPGWTWALVGPGLVRRTHFLVLAHLAVPPASGPHFLGHQLGKMLPSDACLQARDTGPLSMPTGEGTDSPQGTALTPLGPLTPKALRIWPQPPLPAHRSCCVSTSLFCLPPRVSVLPQAPDALSHGPGCG